MAYVWQCESLAVTTCCLQDANALGQQKQQEVQTNAPVAALDISACPLETPFSPRITSQLGPNNSPALNDDLRRDLLNRIRIQKSQGELCS